MYGWDVGVYERKASAFGWEPIVIDGHDYGEIFAAFKKALEAKEKPVMIIARTIKGKGVPAVEDKNGWHGKALKKEDVDEAIRLLEPLDRSIRGQMRVPRTWSRPSGRRECPTDPRTSRGRPSPPGRPTATP